MSLSEVATVVCACAHAADRQSLDSDVTIEKDEVQRGDIIVVGHDAKIVGQVKGSVAVLYGNAWVAPGAQVRGDVIVLGGQLKAEGEIIGDRVALPSINLGLLVGSVIEDQADSLEARVKDLVGEAGGSRVSVGQPLRIDIRKIREFRNCEKVSQGKDGAFLVFVLLSRVKR